MPLFVRNEPIYNVRLVCNIDIYISPILFPPACHTKTVMFLPQKTIANNHDDRGIPIYLGVCFGVGYVVAFLPLVASRPIYRLLCRVLDASAPISRPFLGTQHERPKNADYGPQEAPHHGRYRRPYIDRMPAFVRVFFRSVWWFGMYVCAVFPRVYNPETLLVCWVLTLLEPQSRFGDKPLKFQVVCPQNRTGVLKGLTESLESGVILSIYYRRTRTRLNLEQGATTGRSAPHTTERYVVWTTAREV